MPRARPLSGSQQDREPSDRRSDCRAFSGHGVNSCQSQASYLRQPRLQARSGAQKSQTATASPQEQAWVRQKAQAQVGSPRTKLPGLWVLAFTCSICFGGKAHYSLHPITSNRLSPVLGKDSQWRLLHPRAPSHRPATPTPKAGQGRGHPHPEFSRQREPLSSSKDKQPFPVAPSIHKHSRSTH